MIPSHQFDWWYLTNFSSPDVMRFLGKRVNLDGNVPGTFNGELTNDIKHRPEGARIKYNANKNSVKMYNKQGSVLRVETTINNPKEFKVYRPKQDGEINACELLPLRKGIADITRRAEVSDAVNNRYLDSIAQVQHISLLNEIFRSICQHTFWNGKRVRALRPFSREDAILMDAVSSGDFLINGFTNREIQNEIFSDEEISTSGQRKSRQL
jgi:hypothetical protein